jgi:hypothetical protein
MTEEYVDSNLRGFLVQPVEDKPQIQYRKAYESLQEDKKIMREVIEIELKAKYLVRTAIWLSIGIILGASISALYYSGYLTP